MRFGGSVRLPEGSYDVHLTFADGLVRREMRLSNPAFSGRVDRTVEFGLTFAEPTVTVTENGTSVGDQATITYFETARVVAGKFDLRATLFSSEGWLRDVELTGKPHLTIALQAVKTEQLRVGGPARRSAATPTMSAPRRTT